MEIDVNLNNKQKLVRVTKICPKCESESDSMIFSGHGCARWWSRRGTFCRAKSAHLHVFCMVCGFDWEAA
jgi:hypothetical protein